MDGPLDGDIEETTGAVIASEYEIKNWIYVI